jgi:hypothetical protein
MELATNITSIVPVVVANVTSIVPVVVANVTEVVAPVVVANVTAIVETLTDPENVDTAVDAVTIIASQWSHYFIFGTAIFGLFWGTV